MLLYYIGETSEDVLNATGIQNTTKRTNDKVLTKFDDHFQVRKYLIIEIAHFDMMKQANGALHHCTVSGSK